MAFLRSRRWVSISPTSNRLNDIRKKEEEGSRNYENGDDPEIGSDNQSDTSKEQRSDDNNNSSVQSILLLNVVAILWGSQHVVIKSCVSSSASLLSSSGDVVDPASFTFLRFGLATLLALPFCDFHAAFKRDTIRWGIELGLWMFLGYSFQAIGLEYTTAQKSGFLLYLNVKFVPLLAYILYRRRISIPTAVSAVVAVLGTMLLLLDDGTTTFSWNIGDLWCIAAAAASAMFILRLELASSSVVSASALNVTCLGTVALASFLWWSFTTTTTTLMTTSSSSILSPSIQRQVQLLKDILSANFYELLYLSVITTTLCNWIQTKAQQHVSAERASIIYAMDPVWGALWAHVLLGESLSQNGFLGAIVITVAAVANGILDFTTTADSKRGKINNKLDDISE